MTTANNVKLINLLSDRYKFDANDAIEYVKTASKKGRPKKEIQVEQAKDLFDKILEDAGEPPLEKDPALYKKFEKAPEKVDKATEKEAKKLEKEKKEAEKAAEKEKKAAEKEAKKQEKEKKAAEKEAKKQEKEKKAAEKEIKKEVKPVVIVPQVPVKTITQVESSDDDSSDDEEEEEEEDNKQVELKPEQKELVVIKHTPVEELVIDESSDDEIDEDVNKIVQSVMKAKMEKYAAIKDAVDSEEEESDDEDEEEEEEEEEVVKVKRVKINDKDYLKSTNNVLYDVDTNDAIGVWDENKQEIILNELDEDSYVEDDDNEDESDDEDEE